MKPLVERRRRSARERFAECKLRYAVEYLDGVSDESEPARRGSMFHRFRELYVQRLFKAKLRADHELALMSLEQARIELPLPHAEWLDVERIASRFMPWYELDIDTFVSTEGAVPGFADTLLRFDEVTVPRSDTLRIKDCKTHWAIPTTQTLRESYQTGFYLAAARRLMPGFAHYTMQYEFARWTTLSDVIELAPAELDAIDQSIKESDEAMDIAETSQVFPPTGGKHCGTCKARCPLVDHDQRDMVRAEGHEDAALMVGKIEAMQRTINIYRDALRAWCDSHGPYSVAGITYAHHPVTRESYDLRDVVDVLKAAKVDLNTVPKGVFASSGSHMKALTGSKKKWAFIADAIKALGKVDTYTQFGAKSTKPDEDETPEEVNGNV